LADEFGQFWGRLLADELGNLGLLSLALGETGNFGLFVFGFSRNWQIWVFVFGSSFLEETSLETWMQTGIS
jgi:hypothetical protein